MAKKGKAKLPKKNVKKRTERKKEDELRKAERLNEEHEITITIVSEVENLPKEKIRYKFSKDISESGIKIQGNIPLPVDTLLKIDLTLESLHQKITALGKIKRIEFNTEDGSYEAGVEFVDTSSEAIQKIEDYISRKQRTASLDKFVMRFGISEKINEPKSK